MSLGGAAAAAAVLCSNNPGPAAGASAAGSTVGPGVGAAPPSGAGAGGAPLSVWARAAPTPVRQIDTAKQAESLMGGLARGPGPLAHGEDHRIAGRRAAEDQLVPALDRPLLQQAPVGDADGGAGGVAVEPVGVDALGRIDADVVEDFSHHDLARLMED